MIKSGFFQNSWRLLTTPRAQDRDEARREYMTKVILLVLSLISLGLTLLSLGGAILGSIPFDTLGIVLGMVVVFGGGLGVAYRGRWRWASYLPTLLIFATAVYGNYIGGIGAPAMLLYALAIMLSAVLQGGWAQWIALGLSLGSYVGLGYAHANGYITQLRFEETAFVNRATIVAGVLVSMAFLQWFLINQFQRALTQVHTYADEVAVFRALADHAVMAVMMADLEGHLTYANQSSYDLCENNGVDSHLIGKNLMVLGFEGLPPLDTKVALQDVIEAGGWQGEVQLPCTEDEVLIFNLSLFPVRDATGRVTNLGIIIEDITAREQAVLERERLQQQIIDAQRRTLVELSAPVIPLVSISGYGSVIVMPLIGRINAARAKNLTHAMLAGIREHHARVIILDVTGVPSMGEDVVRYLNKTVQTARLKGARTIVSGISNAVAEAIVESDWQAQGIDWRQVETVSDLHTGLSIALRDLKQAAVK